MTPHKNRKHSNTEVILLSPSPPPIGGVASWTESILEIKSKSILNIYHINTSSKNILPTCNRKNIFIKLRRFFTITITIRHIVKRIISNNKFSNQILHVSTSGKIGFIKDLMFILCSKLFNKKIILHLHYGDCETDFKSSKIIRLLTITSFCLANKIIAIDSKTFKFIKGITKKNKVYFLNNGFNLDLKIKTKRNREQITYVGRIEKAKGSYELLDAFLETKDFKINRQLTLIGDCLDNKLIEKINSSENIKWVGRKSRDFVLKTLRESICLCLPSYSEGMPYVVIEAMSLGTPVIASKVGGLIDLLGEDYKLFIDSISKKSIFKKIVSLNSTSLLNKEVSNYLKGRYHKFFTGDIMLKRLDEIWTDF